MPTQLTGQLLVATHDLSDPGFRRAVIFLLAHDATEGAAGVILNRPTSVELPERLNAWRSVATTPAVLFNGGPVSRDTVIAVAVTRAGRAPTGWQPVLDRVGVIDLHADAALAGCELAGMRLFSGYAGWEAGQLEREIASGAWFTVAPTPHDALTTAPDELWRAVLARQGGLFTTVPLDPTLN